jgi:hypothetical protein
VIAPSADHQPPSVTHSPRALVATAVRTSISTSTASPPSPAKPANGSSPPAPPTELTSAEEAESLVTAEPRCGTPPLGEHARPDSGSPGRGEDRDGMPFPLTIETTPHPALIPHEAAGSSRQYPRIPATAGRKILHLPEIPAYPRPGRKRQDRPVTPEVAGWSPVAPVSATGRERTSSREPESTLRVPIRRCRVGRAAAGPGRMTHDPHHQLDCVVVIDSLSPGEGPPSVEIDSESVRDPLPRRRSNDRDGRGGIHALRPPHPPRPGRTSRHTRHRPRHKRK